MLTTILLLIGILTWPEMTLCVLLVTQGYPILGIIALITMFGSGSRWATNRIVGKK